MNFYTAPKIVQNHKGSTPDYYVYTDGACSNNGRQTAKAGYGIFFAEGDIRNKSVAVQGKQSNNTAELSAILYTYPLIKDDLIQGKRVEIISDSVYAIRCVTTYGEKCSKTGWREDIPNKDLVRQTYELYKDVSNVSFTHVPAHTGRGDVHSLGNSQADRLANEAIGVKSTNTSATAKIYLNVPFAKKDEAKELGAKWDASKKKWYVLENAPRKEELLAKF